MKNRLENCPKEVFDKIFEFFWCDEILNLFSKQNEKISGFVKNYFGLKLNLKSISKRKFDEILGQIDGKQIESLVFSDDEATANVASLFFEKIPVESLIRLKSLKFVRIENLSVGSTSFLPTTFNFDFSSLRRLSFPSFSTDQIRRIFKRKSNFRWLDFSTNILACAAIDFFSEPIEIFHEQLVDLKIRFSSTSKSS